MGSHNTRLPRPDDYAPLHTESIVRFLLSKFALVSEHCATGCVIISRIHTCVVWISQASHIRNTVNFRSYYRTCKSCRFSDNFLKISIFGRKPSFGRYPPAPMAVALPRPAWLYGSPGYRLDGQPLWLAFRCLIWAYVHMFSYSDDRTRKGSAHTWARRTYVRLYTPGGVSGCWRNCGNFVYSLPFGVSKFREGISYFSGWIYDIPLKGVRAVECR